MDDTILPSEADVAELLDSIGETDPMLEVDPMLEPEAELDAMLEADPMLEVDPMLEADPLLEADPMLEPEIEAELEAVIEPELEAVVEPEPEIEPEAETIPELISELDQVLEPDPMREPDPAFATEPEPELEIEPMPELEAEPLPEIEFEPEPEPELPPAKSKVDCVETETSQLATNIRHKMSVIETISHLLSGAGSEVASAVAQAIGSEEAMPLESTSAYEIKVDAIEESLAEFAESIRQDLKVMDAISNLLSGAKDEPSAVGTKSKKSTK
ncbi:MAG: hypothetical protein FWD44_07645 [Oscillospiraceae bacterium]|nr:hypothetical protein [Oscillospiraceae bacterium]